MIVWFSSGCLNHWPLKFLKITMAITHTQAPFSYILWEKEEIRGSCYFCFRILLTPWDIRGIGLGKPREKMQYYLTGQESTCAPIGGDLSIRRETQRQACSIHKTGTMETIQKYEIVSQVRLLSGSLGQEQASSSHTDLLWWIVTFALLELFAALKGCNIPRDVIGIPYKWQHQ